MKRNTYTRPTTPRVVESGSNWIICFDPSTRDYSVYTAEMEYIGSRATQAEARTLALGM